MPYEIREDGDRFCIYNKETDEEKACHDDREDAERQMKLLHMIERGEDPEHD